MTPRALRNIVSALVLASSGFYFFLYLYRWEWNRALIAAAIFIMMEIVVLASAVLGRLRALEEKIAGAQQPSPIERIEESAPPPRANFRWLTGGGDQTSVFVPVLMGAGLLVSGVAWLVERFAHATARPVLEYRLATSLAPLALPAGGFVQDLPAPQIPRIKRRGRQTFLILALAAALSIGVDQLGDLTQTRPDVVSPGASTTISLSITANGWSRSRLAAAETLWAVCRTTVPPNLTSSGFSETSPGTFSLTLSSALGEHTVRQVRGCIDDATIDNVQARINSITSETPL
jgi:hypothetical protein